MRYILILGLALFLVSCKSKKLTADSPERFVIENLAGISSAEDLKRIYPAANMVEGTDLFEEGTEEHPYTVLFPDTDKEALITWKDNSRSKIHSIRIDQGTDWKSETGLKIGTTYEELVRLNKKPIKFYGFGWDFSGAVDWNGGKLAGTDVRVFLAPDGTPPGKFYGDKIIEASEEEIAALGLTVQAIWFQKS